MTDTPKEYDSRVVSVRQLSETGYELTMERKGLTCEAGRLILIHGKEDTDDRSYTLASGAEDEHIQVLYRYIPTGKLTPQLLELKEGDPIKFSGPYGEFTVNDPSKPIVFIATGTGVAPARAYIKSHENLSLTLIHGTRVAEDLFYREEFEAYDYQPCVTREEGTGFHGRVTDYMKTREFPADAHYYLCGANEMIFDVNMLLHERGVAEDQVFTEAYYYRLHS